MPYMHDIWLLRHGEQAEHGSGRFLGQRDVPLSPHGVQQAAGWQSVFAHIPFALTVSSDLTRCVQTADAALAGHPAQRATDARLREIHLGAWQGLNMEEVEKRFPGESVRRNADPANFAPQQGESFRQVADRANKALRQHTEQAALLGGPLLLVTHLGVYRCLLCALLDIPLHNVLRIQTEYAHAALLRFDGRARVLAAHNIPAQSAALFSAGQ